MLAMLGKTVLTILFLYAAYSFCKQNKQLIRLLMVYVFLAVLIHALGIEFGAVPIVIGFLFAVLALCKIVYNL